MDRESFARSLREAIEHLHDRSYLATHPLAEILGDGRAPLSGDQVRRALRDAIEELKPVGGPASHEADWRRYRQLILRYVEGQSLEQVAHALDVSVRQASRDQQKALAALTALLWVRRRPPGPEPSRAPPPPPTLPDEGAGPDERADELAAEVAKVAANEQSIASLAETVDGVLSVLVTLSTKRGIAFAVSVADTLPPVAISPTLLRQAILNLLIYTCEVASAGQISLIGADTARGVTLRVVHQDAGRIEPGSIAPRDRPETGHLFEVARQLLEAQGGAVEADGDADDGLLLRVVLPPIQLRKVLVVDDNPDVVGLFRRFLRDEPYRLIQATSGRSALRLAKELRPDVVILDVMIPSQDGWNILQQLRGLPETAVTPIVVCSVLPERALALALGVDEFLSKPVTKQSLLAALERCCLDRGESRVRS